MEVTCALCRSRISTDASEIQNGCPDKGLKGVPKILKIYTHSFWTIIKIVYKCQQATIRNIKSHFTILHCLNLGDWEPPELQYHSVLLVISCPRRDAPKQSGVLVSSKQLKGVGCCLNIICLRRVKCGSFLVLSRLALPWTDIGRRCEIRKTKTSRLTDRSIRYLRNY